MKLEIPTDDRHRLSTDDRTLPLINVAFLLLIFFLLAGTVIAPDRIRVDDLELSHGVPAVDTAKQLLVAHDQQLAYQGRIIDKSELSAVLFADLQGPLLVRVDANTDARYVVDVLRRLAGAGVSHVRIAGVAIGLARLSVDAGVSRP